MALCAYIEQIYVFVAASMSHLQTDDNGLAFTKFITDRSYYDIVKDWPGDLLNVTPAYVSLHGIWRNVCRDDT